MTLPLAIAPEIEAGRAAGAPIVALESTIISHGLPWPDNAETARRVEDDIRAAGALREGHFVLSKVRALKYGTFMPPGSTLRVEVTLGGRLEDGSFDFKGEAKKLGSSPGEGLPDLTAVSGRFSLRAASPWQPATAT